MYYPTLSSMSRYQVDDFLSRRLDVWLATRRKAVRRFLSPLQFSLDTEIDEEIAITLFIICIQKDIGILDVNYIAKCHCCDEILGTFRSINDVPKQVHCKECNKDIAVHKDDIVMWFELNKEPVTQPLSTPGHNLTRGGNCLGKIQAFE